MWPLFTLSTSIYIKLKVENEVFYWKKQTNKLKTRKVKMYEIVNRVTQINGYYEKIWLHLCR